MAHHNTDLWTHTVPVDKVGSGLWPMGCGLAQASTSGITTTSVATATSSP